MRGKDSLDRSPPAKLNPEKDGLRSNFDSLHSQIAFLKMLLNKKFVLEQNNSTWRFAAGILFQKQSVAIDYCRWQESSRVDDENRDNPKSNDTHLIRPEPRLQPVRVP